MKRRLFNLIFLSVLLGTGLVPLAITVDGTNGIAWADGGRDRGDSGDHGDSHDSEDHGDNGGDDNGGGDNGGGDNGGGDNGGGDNGGGDNGGGDNGGSDNGGDDNGDNSSSDGGGFSAEDHNSGRLFQADGINLIYTNGTSERIAQGTYERLDRHGRVIERRTATSADRNRLGGLRDGISPVARRSGVESVITVSAKRKSIKIVDSAGWTELLENNRYVLTDPNGNVVTQRAATARDIARISATLGLS